MALLTHSGLGSTDMGVAGTIRQDISDFLLASLVPENNLLGLIDVGPEIGDTVCRWVEDRLNNNIVTDVTGAGAGLNTAGPPAAATTTNITVSAADAAILDIGWVLADEAAGGIVNGEQVQITAIAGTTVSVVRGYGGTTTQVHATNCVLRIVSAPTYENSDLGRDMSRARIPKSNVISRFECNVNMSSETIERAQAGYAPGVGDELYYQFRQRVTEMKRRMAQALVYSRPSSANMANALTGDYSTFAGVVSWLDGTVNATAAASAQAGAIFSDGMLNAQNKTLFRNGVLCDWLVVGPNGAEKVGQLYNDRIRIETNDRGRGFWARYFDTTLGNTLRVVMDPWIYDTSPNGAVMLLDSARLRIRPFRNQFFYLIQAPSFRDGDAVRALSKWSLEFRNSGTDVGAAHTLFTGVGY